MDIASIIINIKKVEDEELPSETIVEPEAVAATEVCDVCDADPCVCDHELCGTCASAPCVCPEPEEVDIASQIAELAKLAGAPTPQPVTESILVEIKKIDANIIPLVNELGRLMLKHAKQAMMRGETSENPKSAEKIRNYTRVGGVLADFGGLEHDEKSLAQLSNDDIKFAADYLKMPVEQFMKKIGIKEGVEMRPYQEENDLEPMSKKQVMGDQPLVNNTGDNSMIDAEKPVKKLAVKTIKEAADLIREMEMCEENFNVGDSVRVASDNMHYGDMVGHVESIDPETGDIAVEIEDFGKVMMSPRELHKNHAMHPVFENRSGPYANEEHAENVVSDALTNFDIKDFLEYCGSDFGWDASANKPYDGEELDYSTQYILSSLVGYIEHWIGVHRDEQMDIETSEVTRLYKEEVLPFLSNHGYHIAPEMKAIESIKEDNGTERHEHEAVCPICDENPCECDDKDDKEDLKESSIEDVRKQITDVSDKIDAIVKDGGVVSLTDPLSVKLSSLRRKLKKMKKVNEAAETLCPECHSEPCQCDTVEKAGKEEIKEGLTYGDKVIITGDRHHMGDEGEVVSMDKERGTAIVKLDGHGRMSFPLRNITKKELEEEGALMDATPAPEEKELEHSVQDLQSLAKEILAADDTTYNDIIMGLFGYSDPEHIISEQHIVDQLTSLHPDEVSAISAQLWVPEDQEVDMDGSRVMNPEPEVDEGNSHDDLRANPSDHDTLMHKNIADAHKGLSGNAYAGQLVEVGEDEFDARMSAKDLTDKILKLDDKKYVEACKILFDPKDIYKPHDKMDILVAVESSDRADISDLEELLTRHESEIDKLEEDSITEEELSEKAPPGMEAWVKANKAKFKKEYGDKKGEEILYATAWKKHNESVEAVENKLIEEFNSFEDSEDEKKK